MKHQKRGFSFIQILIILILIAVVVVALIYFIKPAKMLEKSRDAQRFADIKTLASAVNQYLADNHNFKGLVGPYSSIDASFTDATARQNIDSTGWLPLNLKLISTGAPFEKLPIDPLNNSTYNYRFGVSVANNTYELVCTFESPENASKESNDNGNNPNSYELGTDLTIL